MEHERDSGGGVEIARPVSTAASPHATGTLSHVPRGQAITELALIVPVLVLIFVGVLDLGRAYHTQVAASNAARVGILYAQQVASPRMLDCDPRTTCYFIKVADVISTTKQEAQGGIDPAQMQVNVCLQHVSACPITDTSEAVASNEAITVSVTVPFTTITPFVHLKYISGAVSGRTFPFEPVAPTITVGPPATSTGTATATSTATPTPTNTATTMPTATNTSSPGPTNTPGGPTSTPTGTPTNTATATSTPSNTATPGPTSTPTLEPTPQIVSAPSQQVTGNGNNIVVTIRWSVQYPATNDIYIYYPNNTPPGFRPAGSTHSGTWGSNSFQRSSNNGGQITLPKGTYHYYVQSATTGGTVTYPTDGAGCIASADCLTFTL